MENISSIELHQRLIELDTPSLADAMDSIGIYGALQGIDSRVIGQKTIAGPAFTVTYQPFQRKEGEFHNAGNYIDLVNPGNVIVIDNAGHHDCTVWGDILTEVAIHKGIVGTIINGAARDIEEVRRLNFPLFSAAIYMVSGKNRVKLSATQVPVQIGTVTVYPGDWVVADGSGVVVMPAEHLENLLLRAEKIHNTEQQIRLAVRDGVPLENARSHYGYDRPWAKARDHE